MRTLIIEDELHGRIALKNQIQRYCPSLELIGEAESFAEGYDRILTLKPDLLLLDLELGDGNGIQLIESLPKGFETPRIIFTTAYDQYAVKAFRLNAIDYLLKPINPDQLTYAVNKAIQEFDQKHIQIQQLEWLKEQRNEIKDNAGDKIVISTHQGLIQIVINEIIRCEANSNYTTFYLSNGQKIMATRSLIEFEDSLTDFDFFRIHKSHLINTRQIKKIDWNTMQVIMNDDSCIEIARRRKDAFLTLVS
ncbi:MAG: hypothetical protein RLZZ175_2452 [Bacteroidota bacterium]|jgi:two-component system LytT family response regulator